jgi:hypothetical protein
MEIKLETLLWQIVIFILGLFLILTIREYLFDKNEIEAETARTNCILEFKKLGETEFEDCKNIATYRSGEKGLY